MNFAQVKGISIPQGSVKELAQGLTVLWKQGGAPLPYDAELEWIASDTGYQYIDLGFRASQAISVKVGIWRSGASKRWDCGAQSGWSSNTARIVVIESGASNAWWRYGNNGVSVTGQGNLIGNLELVANQREATFKNLDNQTSYTATAPAVSNFTTPGNFYLFTYNNNGSPDFGGGVSAGIRLKYAQITDNGVDLDLIPVRVGSVGYMYDKNSGTFYGNAGTGAFILGPDKYTASKTLAVTLPSAVSGQGGATYGDYYITLAGPNTTAWLFNLNTATLVQQISIPSSERGFVSDCHSNTVNFGTEFYDAGDDFPLLYVSTGYGDGTDTGCLVYRIVNNGGTYSLVLVQTLKFPGTEWTEFVPAGNDCYVYRSEVAGQVYYKFPMPTLQDGGTVTFDFTQAVASYNFGDQPAWYDGSSPQGRLYSNGRIIYPSGYPPSQKLLLIVLNLATLRREYEIDLAALGLTLEPEAAFYWNGQLCLFFWQSANIYAISYSR